MAYTAHLSVATIHNALAFNHSAILLKNLVYASHIESRTCLKPTRRPIWTFVEGRTRTRGVYGAYVRGYDSQRSGLNHSAILLPW